MVAWPDCHHHDAGARWCSCCAPRGYAEFVTVDADSIARVPDAVEPIQAAALGLVGVTAYLGLTKIGSLRGKRILITGAAGGVGSAATGIARAQGASVIGLVSRTEQASYVSAQGADDVIVSPRGATPALEIGSVDGVLDAVGGDLFGPCVNALRSGGVLSLIGAVAGANVRFDAWQLIRPVTLTGYSTETLDGPVLRNATAALTNWLAAGAVRAPDHQVMPLRHAARAHALLEAGGSQRRVLLTP